MQEDKNTDNVSIETKSNEIFPTDKKQEIIDVVNKDVENKINVPLNNTVIEKQQSKINTEPQSLNAPTIPVVRNDSFQKITIQNGAKVWTIHKGAQIPLTSIPQWVKSNPEFQAHRRDKTLIFSILSINR